MGKMVDNERLARLVAALDARMKEAVQAEEERARLAEGELQEALDEIEDMAGGRTIVYLTQIEFDALTDDEKNDDTKAYFIIDAEEYNIWVGTTEELEAMTDRDPNTIYFELEEEESDNNVVPITVINGVVSLTNDRYQKINEVVDGDIQFVFPEIDVTEFTEISVFFSVGTDVNIAFPENCKWRVDPNINKAKAFEVVCKYNTMMWLVNVIAYS